MTNFSLNGYDVLLAKEKKWTQCRLNVAVSFFHTQLAGSLLSNR